MLVVVIFLLRPLGLSAKDDWPAITPEELAETAPKLLPDAAAEILDYKVTMDDSDFPGERLRREYLRAKIYKPEHIEGLTRISGRETFDDSYTGSDSTVKLRARLTLPDGTSKVFGENAIRERVLAQSGERNLLERMLGATGQQVKERFLAIGGVEAGAILEYVIERRERGGIGYRPYNIYTFQRSGMAIRKAQIVVTPPSTADWLYSYMILNPAVGHALMKEDPKRKTLTLDAADVPPFTEEPLAGLSFSYHALCLMSCYERKERTHIARQTSVSYRVEPKKTGLWSSYSISDFKVQENYFEITPRIRKLTEETVGDAKEPTEKAKRIHDRLRALYGQFVRESKFNKAEIRLENFSRTLDDLLSYDRKSQVMGISQMDYIVLGMAMYKVAGIESRMVLLPDRRAAPFNRKLASRVFIPHRALQVRLGDQWVFSMPTIQPDLSLGEIPWYCEGQVALLVKDGPEEFIPVPFSDSTKTLIGNGGTFELTPDGALVGTAKRKYTGNAAFVLRTRLLNRDPSRQRGILARQISHDFKVALKRTKASEDEGEESEGEHAAGAVSIKRITGLDTSDAPLEIEYKLTLPNFATVSGQRLIFRPWVFRAEATNPFSSDTRTNNVYFPYALQELDLITIKLPAGSKVEFTQETAPSAGQVLHYKAVLSFDEKTSTLKLRREYACNVVVIPASLYPSLKNWYDTMTRIDQQEVVATGVGPEPGSVPSTETPKSTLPAPSPESPPAAAPSASLDRAPREPQAFRDSWALTQAVSSHQATTT